MQRYLTLREVSGLLGGRSRSAIYVDVAAGRLPQPVKIGGRIYWPEADLAARQAALEAERGAGDVAPMKGAA